MGEMVQLFAFITNIFTNVIYYTTIQVQPITIQTKFGIIRYTIVVQYALLVVKTEKGFICFLFVQSEEKH